MIVLISHYNNPEGLRRSLESIDLNECDVLVVDDGSSRKPFQEEISRKGIEIIFNKENLGLERSLNVGLDYILKNSKHKYVARLDCGDIALNNRFQIQKKYLEEHPDIHLLGSHVTFVNQKGIYLYTYKVPIEHNTIRKKMFIRNSFIHPSVMMRLDTIRKIGNYPTNYKYAEDYALFFNIVKNFKTANIDEVLTICTLNKNGISASKRKPQMKSKFKVLYKNKSLSLHYVLGLSRTALLYLIPNSLNTGLKMIYYK